MRSPNIVLILADDLGVNDSNCYGRRDHRTPRLDRLAAEGMRFTTAYAAQPIWSPTRAALMTGKAPARLHLTTYLPGRPDAASQLLLHPQIEQQLPLTETTLAERLKTAGYATACIGKWHLGGQGFLPTDQGFDQYYPGRADTPPSADEGGKGEYELTTRAKTFIEANAGGPFFLYLAHNSPHIPLAARPELIEKHREAFNPVYAAMIESLDDCVGRLVDTIEKLGISSETLIVFTSDNGGLHVPEGARTPATHNTPYRAGKGFCYEGGLRVPLMMRWPGKVKAGAVSDTPVISTDLTPTFCELTGIKPDEPLDGLSLAGLFDGKPLAPRPLFWHFPHYTNQGGRPAGAMRQGDWKLIEHYEDGSLELFNLAEDPSEAAEYGIKQPARVAELRGKLEAWRRSVGAQTNRANPTFSTGLWKPLYRDVDVSRLPLGANAAAVAASLKTWREQMNRAVAKQASQSAGGYGAIVLHARDARPHGGKLRYESEPHKDTLGYWVLQDDWVDWQFDLPQAGEFEVELLQGCGSGSGGAEIEVGIADQTLPLKIIETGHFQRFVPRSLGTVKLDKPGRQTLSVRAKTKPGGAVMDLRRVTLRSAR